MAWLLSQETDISVDLPAYPAYRPVLPSSQAGWQRLLDWFNQLDDMSTNPVPRSGRLGVYFERLVRYWLQHQPLTEQAPEQSVVRHNYPIYRPAPFNQQTEGELDLLLTMGVQRFLHLELAVKFYLRPSPGSNLWVGPNARDQLHRKIQHLADHQLPMGDKGLAQLGLPGTLSSQYWLKGYLFEPWQHHEMLSGEHLWLREKDLRTFFKVNPDPGFILDKPHWLGGLYLNDSDLGSPATSESVQNQLSEFNAVMLGHFAHYPLNRVMVVHNTWPNKQ